jgi:hypothetical protein
VGEFGVEEGSALALGEPGLARAEVQEKVAGLAEVAADREVAATPLAVLGTPGIVAAEIGEIVRGQESSWGESCGRVRSWITRLLIGTTLFNFCRTPPNRAGTEKDLTTNHANLNERDGLIRRSAARSLIRRFL